MKRGSYGVGRARREQILEAATLHFARTGYYGTSLSAIARDIGISINGLMHHFPTKQHLLVALADYRFSLFNQWAQEEKGPDEDGLGFLRETIEMSRRMAAKPGLIELFVILACAAADPTSPVHELNRQRYAAVIAIGEEKYKEGVERGVFQPDIDCEALARSDIAVSDGLQLQWALSHGGFDLAAAIKTHHEKQLKSIVMPGVVIDLSPRKKVRT